MKKLLVRTLLALLAAVLLVCIAVLLHAEWTYRSAVPAAPPATFEGSFMRSEPADAPVIILMHGAGLNRHMWDSVVPHLSPAYRVMSLDLPGHGTRRDEIYTLEGVRTTLAAAARSVAPAPVLLVGDSLGGYSAFAGADAVPAAQLRGLMVGGASANFKWSKVAGYAGNVLFLRSLLLRVDEQVLFEKALAKAGADDVASRGMMAAGSSMRAYPYALRSLLREDFLPRLAALNVPVLLVNGDLDTRSVQGEDTYAAAIKDVQRYRFKDTAHGVSLRRPAEFAAQLDRFAATAFATP
jgi:pimeloyl-ACP methyl ester carboxylesterase